MGFTFSGLSLQYSCQFLHFSIHSCAAHFSTEKSICTWFSPAYFISILSFSSPNDLTSAGVMFTGFSLLASACSISLLNLSMVALIPMMIGIGSRLSEGLPRMNFCIIEFASCFSLPSFIPRCASSMMTKKRWPLCSRVFCSVCQME